MRKRVTYLIRRPDVSSEQFRAHWRDVHGPIAARFRGLAKYNQNHVLQTLDGEPSARYVDGLVELWFDETAGETPGRDEEVTTELIVDEPRFLSGLTGYAVEDGDPYGDSRFKVWILGRWSGNGPDVDGLVRIVDRLAAVLPHAAEIHWHAASPSRPLFSREALVVDPQPPHAAIIVCFGDTHPLSMDRDRILSTLSRLTPGVLVDVVSVVAREERIV